jgi:hypothetical protein
MRGRKGKGHVMLAWLWWSRARDRKREESTVASGGSLLSGGRARQGRGSVRCHVGAGEGVKRGGGVQLRVGQHDTGRARRARCKQGGSGA